MSGFLKMILRITLLKPDEYAGYLSELEEKMSAVDDHIHTGNSYLDILLQEKRSACEEDDIKLDAQIIFIHNRTHSGDFQFFLQ